MATEKIDLNNLDKSDWKTYRFDEIAHNISERVDPNNTDLEVYIGLEHIDSESLHIKRHGTPDDVNGTKLKFYKDDIIFGRRRAYQRKAGIATCDGFCSAHALVLRANPDVIDPVLFPFFMHSDLFMNRAVDISVGSLSPTINWGTLKHQEFLLPPLTLQSRIQELALISYENVKSCSLQIEKADILKKTLRYTHFQSVRGEKTFIGEVADVQAGFGFPIKYQGESDKEHSFFKVGDMNYEFNTPVMKVADNTISEEERIAIKAKLHKKGTVIFPKVGAAIATEKKRILALDALVDNNVMGLTVKNENSLPPHYLLEIMEAISLDAISNAGTVPSINAKIVKSIPITIPSISEIVSYLSTIKRCEELLVKARSHRDNAVALEKALINKVF
ncbi:restriction endonuclease subunit S [Psychrobacter faecalis]|uniref:Restriction endonuclease subunit S n=1 Tax=Psychrobacter faecalis TaxID=180588 RepID=A0ABT9HFP2_9GAMM|nr:restriction endonuclease subunit S [Psychrobacter faecalis]MDP4544580.1 restriction endonuclease subunit S [Psychrobacter faecalis]